MGVLVTQFRGGVAFWVPAAKLEQYFFSNSITKEFNIRGNFVDAHIIDLGYNDVVAWSGQEFAMIPT